MDFGTFYRMRQFRERTRDVVTNDDDVNQSENFSQLPVQGSVYSDFDHPSHPQFNHSRGFEGVEANFFGNNAIGRDFGNDQSWEFPDERGLGGLRDPRGRGGARGGEREMGPSGMRGRGFGPGRGWPSDCGRGPAFNENPWTDHVDATGPWHHEGGDVWGEERRDLVQQRETQNNSSDQDKLEHVADLRRPVTSKDPQYPEDSGNERNPPELSVSSNISNMKASDLPGTSSDAVVPVPAKAEEKQTLKDQKLYVKEDEKTDDHDGNKSSQQTSDQKSKNISDDAVSVNRVEGKTQDKLWENGTVGDIEDMAVTQLQDPNRTVFSCCYCGVSNYSIDEFKDHVKGNSHKEGYSKDGFSSTACIGMCVTISSWSLAFRVSMLIDGMEMKFSSLIEGKRCRQQNNSLMEFKREELGKHSFLEMDLDTFRKEPVIGLSYVTEFQCIFGIKCICHLCGIMFSHIGGQNHVINIQHRMSYLKEKSPNSYETIRHKPTRQARMNAMLYILQDAEHHDGRGTPAIYVFECKSNSKGNSSSSSDESDALKFRQAFGEFVNQELQTARQKIADFPLLFDEEQEEDYTFSDQSAYVQLWDLEGDRERFFDEKITDGSTDYADTTHDDAADASFDSLKLRAVDISGPSSDVPGFGSVNKSKKEEKEPAIKEMKKEKEGKEKKDDQEGSDGKRDDQEGSDGKKMPKQDADDKTNSEDKGKPAHRTIIAWFPRHELGRISYLKKGLKNLAEPVIGLSYVTEYQHTTAINCTCNLCGVVFAQRCSQTHLLSYKHRMRYLRERRPSIYAEFAQLSSKKEIVAKMLPLLKHITRIDGSGTPEIQVFDGKNGVLQSSSESDNQNEDDCASTELPQAEIDRQHSEFLKLMREENLKVKALEREPVVFELGPRQDYPPSDPLSNRPPCPDPRFQERPLMHDPHYREHPHYMRRVDPYFDPDPFEISRRARLYPGEGRLPDPLKQGRGDEPYFDPDPMKRMRQDESYVDPDPLKRGRRHEPYLDPDPLKRIRRGEPYYDPDSLKRRAHREPYLDPDPLKRRAHREPYLDPDPLKRRAPREPYLDPDPLKRFRFDEPFIHPDPLKRVLPSQKAANKPVVIDYGHGSEKKSVKNTADQWEKDIKDILNESKAPDSLAQLSCSYSSPKKEDTPPPPQPKRPLPFSRSYMEKSKELQKKLSSSKAERSQISPDRGESRGRHKPGSPSRKHRRSRSPLSVKDRSRAKFKDPVKRDRTDSSSRVCGRSKSPEIMDSSSSRFKRSKSPKDFRSKEILKSKDQTFMKRQRSRSPVKEKLISSSRADKSISPPRKKSFEGKDLPSREYNKSRNPERFESRTTFKDSKRAYGMIQPNSTNPEENRVDSPLKFTVHEKMYLHHPENSISRQKGSRRPDAFIDLTSDEEIKLPSRKDVRPTHPKVEKSSPEKESEPDTGNDVDEAQADLIAEMLLTMKNSIIGQDADPQSALKAILSQDITSVLLATKKLDEKESPPRVKQVRQDDKSRDSPKRYKEEKAGTSERHFDLKSKVKRTPPPREKIAFSFAGRSRASGNMLSQSVLHFSDEDDDDN